MSIDREQRLATPPHPQTGSSPSVSAFDPTLPSYVLDILEKQYRNYTWNDGKVYALATLDSFLFAAGFVLYDKVTSVPFGSTVLLLAITFLCASVLCCCKHCVPILRSGKSGRNDNLRALTGITTFTSWESYRDAVLHLDSRSMLELTCRQIYGMAHNNSKSHNILYIAAHCTMAGVILLFVAVIIAKYGVTVTGAGHMTALGLWLADPSNASGALAAAVIVALILVGVVLSPYTSGEGSQQ